MPSAANAASNETTTDYFPTVNSASVDFPITVNVYTGDVDAGNTGFFTSEKTSDGAPKVSIALPILVCVIASVLAYIVLRQAKAFRQKNSESLELSSTNTPKILTMVKNPALLLAVCFGFGCAVPTFFLQAGVSRADAEKVTDIDYATTDFQTYVDKKENPYGIAIDYEYNHTLKDGKTDEELVKEAESAETDIEPKSERKIEENGEFIVGSVDLTFTTYNPNGFFADYGVKSGARCSAEDKKERLEQCYKATNLVKDDDVIPSIKEPMSKADFEKLGTAAWGWSDDGKTYYPLYYMIDPTLSTYEKNQTIYFAIKLTSSTPTGAYQSAENFQIYAENNKLTNGMFGKYQLNYNNDGEDMEIPNQSKLFLKTNPGMLDITNVIPGDHGECKKFLGWSRDDSAEDKTLYNSNDDKNNKFKVTAAMIDEAEKKAPDEDDGPISVATLNSNWEPTETGCNTYTVVVNQGFEMLDVDDDAKYSTKGGEYEYKKYCPEVAGDNDCLTKYEYETPDGEKKEIDIASLYTQKANGDQERTTNETATFDLKADIGVPVLKGFRFDGWELYEMSGSGYAKTKEYDYDSTEKEFYEKSGESPVKKNTITINKKGETTTVFLNAKWTLNDPIITVTYYVQDEDDEDGWSDIATWSSDDNEEIKATRHDGGNIEQWIDKNDGMDKISGPALIYDFGSFKNVSGLTCDDDGEGCMWSPNKTKRSIRVEDLAEAEPDNKNRAIFKGEVYLMPNTSSGDD